MIRVVSDAQRCTLCGSVAPCDCDASEANAAHVALGGVDVPSTQTRDVHPELREAFDFRDLVDLPLDEHL